MHTKQQAREDRTNAMDICTNKRPPGLRAALVAVAATLAFGAGATTLADVFAVADRINEQAKASQAKVDALSEETRDLYFEYRTVLKEIEGLRAHNRQQERLIARQQREMGEISANMEKITGVERQVTPLMERMVVGLEQFIELDVPVRSEERRDRVDRLRETLDRQDVAVSEKFSQVLQAFQIENSYGRAMEAYTDRIDVEGTDRVVDVLHVGRVALLYQTSDGAETGYWNRQEKRWEVLDDAYQATVRDGIRMARSQASLNLLPVPVLLEAAQ